jgi:voltage-gated potassium channel
MDKQDLKNIFFISSVTFLTILIGSSSFSIFEVEKNDSVQTFFDSVWWSVVTLTSLGYGDIYPVTVAGRIVGMFLMFFGIILIGVIAGSVSRHYFEKRNLRKNLESS